MKKDFMGINTELADKVNDLIKDKKSKLVKETKEANASLKREVKKTFKDNEDQEKMLTYIEEINKALEELYEYLDGNKYCFTSKLNKIIKSYIVSDENVRDFYSDKINRNSN